MVVDQRVVRKGSRRSGRERAVRDVIRPASACAAEVLSFFPTVRRRPGVRRAVGAWVHGRWDTRYGRPGSTTGRNRPVAVGSPPAFALLRETGHVLIDGDVLDPVLHRLRAGGDLTAARWCRLPGASSRVRATVVQDAITVETGDGHRGVLPASPLALPVRTKAVDRIAVPLVLPLLDDMDGLFAELRRVLAPHGLLSLLLAAPPSFGWRGGGLRRAVRNAWRHRSAVEHPDWLASSADFAVLADNRLDFTLDGAGEDRAQDVRTLCAAGVYPPDLPPEVRPALAAHRSAARTVRLRRVVARR